MECKDCFQKFKTKNQYLNHTCIFRLDTSFGGEVEIQTEAKPSKIAASEPMSVSKKEVHACEICPKKFVSIKFYRKHMEQHLIENSATKMEAHEAPSHDTIDSFNTELETDETTLDPIREINPVSNEISYSCPKCPKVCKTHRGCLSHLKVCRGHLSKKKGVLTVKHIANKALKRKASSMPKEKNTTKAFMPTHLLESAVPDINSGNLENLELSTVNQYNIGKDINISVVHSEIPDLDTGIPATKNPTKHRSPSKMSGSTSALCQMDYNLSENFDLHNRNGTRQKLYTCCVCSKNFRILKDYKAHYVTHDLSEVPRKAVKREVTTPTKKRSSYLYVCSTCPLSFTYIGEYRKHIKSHEMCQITEDQVISSSPAGSGSCAIKYDSAIIAPPDSTPIISNFTSLNCNTSHSAYLPSISQTSTQDISANDIYCTKTVSIPLLSELKHKCPNCPEAFKKIGSFRRHLRSHLNILPYTCKHCLANFFKKHMLIQHIKFNHRGEKKFSCTQCSKKFYHRLGFRRHNIIHFSESPYQCHLCGACFPTVSKRLMHLSYHTIKCPSCQKPFINEDKLFDHIYAEHKDIENCIIPRETKEKLPSDFNELDVESDADSYTSGDSEAENVLTIPKKHRKKKMQHYVCFICEQRFPYQKSLDTHMKSHVIHYCKLCPMFFPYDSQLKAHQKKHMQENANFCLKAFEKLKTSNVQQLSQSDINSLKASVSSTVPSNSSDNHCNSSIIKPQMVENSPQKLYDIINWYDNLKDMIQNLKFPIEHDTYQCFIRVATDLASSLYSEEFVDQETKKTYREIHHELMSVIMKNGQYLLKEN